MNEEHFDPFETLALHDEQIGLILETLQTVAIATQLHITQIHSLEQQLKAIEEKKQQRKINKIAKQYVQ